MGLLLGRILKQSGQPDKGKTERKLKAAASPPHSAVSLWLTDLILKKCSRGSASRKVYRGLFDGEAKPHRTVRRQSRSLARLSCPINQALNNMLP